MYLDSVQSHGLHSQKAVLPVARVDAEVVYTASSTRPLEACLSDLSPTRSLHTCS